MWNGEKKKKQKTILYYTVQNIYNLCPVYF